MMQKTAVGGVFLARTLLHLEHQLGSSEWDWHPVDLFDLDPAAGVFETDTARLRHQIDGDVIVYAANPTGSGCCTLRRALLVTWKSRSAHVAIAGQEKTRHR
jgi:hypothetical protein